MKVIKNINNNVSLCLDSQNNEVVVFGKGIGFMKPPYEIDLKQIQRTYYGIDSSYISMINDIPEEIIDISDKTVNFARMKLDNLTSSNIVFTLADHINFAIQREKKGMNLKLPIDLDIQHLFEAEMEVGQFALQLICKQMKIYLPKDEAVYIALHLINAESMNKNRKEYLDYELIERITEIIEKEFEIKIDKNNINYSRFVSHMHYLVKRGRQNEFVRSENKQLYDSLITTYPKTYICAISICEYLKKSLGWNLSDEECVYLMLHINRLCAREDCYQ